MANQFIGPPLGGLLVAVGATFAFVTPVALWVAAVGALLLVRGPFRIARTGPTALRANIVEGLLFLWHQRVLRTLAVVTGIFNLSTNATFAVFVLYAVGPTSAMRLSATGYGVLLMALAGGSLLGSFVAERVEQLIGRSRSLALNHVASALVASALLVGTPALTANPYLIDAAFVLGSITIVISNVIVVSLRQRVTPDRLLGRVNSGYRLVAWGTMPLGAAIGGGLTEVLGLRAVFAVMALLMVGLLGFLPMLSNSSLAATDSQGPR